MKFIKLTVCLLCMNLSFSQSQSFVRLNFLDYYIEKDFFVKSYAEAEQQCEMIETTLAIVNTKEIQDFLLDNIGNLTGEIQMYGTDGAGPSKKTVKRN